MLAWSWRKSNRSKDKFNGDFSVEIAI